MITGLRIVVVCCALLVGLRAASPQVELSVSPSRLSPGELAIITATMSSLDFFECTLTLPADPHLRLIAREPGPIQLHQNIYHQEHRWIVQAVSSGQVNWSGLSAEFTQHDQQRSIALAPLAITIVPHASADLSFDPEPLPASLMIGEMSWVLLIITAVLAVTLGLGGFLIRKATG